ncbi:unnamed protein product [Candidula unifasciata]|uniref:Uncharacterized protein n=1 Tax=Candidula unifasciata TaxID=100452 RepID=A0A8S3ZZS1_9EUPU|nr:unnamed protein product [Candidula unifasciata]
MTYENQGEFWGSPPKVIPLDPLFESNKIFKLTARSFIKFVSGKEKALVMFYDSSRGNNPLEEELFTSAANASFTEKFGFGAVDCATDFCVCVRFGGCNTPMFKLFSNGYELSAINDPNKINPDQIRMLMKMTPVLHQPRGDIGRIIPIIQS